MTAIIRLLSHYTLVVGMLTIVATAPVLAAGQRISEDGRRAISPKSLSVRMAL